MASITPTLAADSDDVSCRENPLAPQQPIPIIEMQHVPPMEEDSSSTVSLQPSVSIFTATSQHLLSIPQQSTPQPQHVFALSDVVNEEDGAFEPWPEELASAEISIAADGTFIETSSGPAARELKRRYDQRYGVSLSVRSPYAITAFVNQHGKQMFRIGHRELSAPAAEAAEVAAEVEERIGQSKTSSEASQSPRSKRRSRMSMHAFLPPAMFARSVTNNPARPPTAASQASLPRKLRKARSIPDMVSSTIGGGTEEGGSSHAQPSASTYTGRAHSQSVTAVDVPRYAPHNMPLPHPPSIDAFGEVMDWFPSTSASTSYSSHSSFHAGYSSAASSSDQSEDRSIIAYPFGMGVTFESSLKKTTFDFLPPPRHLREMQSFESGLTARQDDSQATSVTSEAESSSDHEPSRPPSVIRINDRHLSLLSQTESRPSSTYEPPGDASMLSQYATTVFDVLQTYRGLPNLDKLSPESEGATVKLSLSSDQTAAPRDDPRFVIWGETSLDWDQDSYSVSRDSINSDSSGPVSNISKRRSSKASKVKSAEPSSLRGTPASNTQRILVAATIERWIAQLTSDLNYDELLDFFLTYRTYISGVDLCHLLISRFHWALQQPKSSQDETVRRIVRVRTFVAIRYWLLTFFTVDFIPNRELRLLIANWLNTMIRDPLLKIHSDGLGIIQRLAKVAKECKQAHTRGIATATTNTNGKPSSPPKSKSENPKVHLLGQKFAEATMKEEEDPDLDLDFLPDEATPENPTLGPNDPANAHLAAAHVGAVLSPARPTSLPLSSFNILQRIDHAPGPNADAEVPFTQTRVALPIHNSALSRAFVKTISRIGRLKRVLHSRSSTRNSLNPCIGVSAFDLELSVSRDLLTVNGGVEQYLKMMEPLSSRQHPPPPPLASQPRPPTPPPPAVLENNSSSTVSIMSLSTPSPAVPILPLLSQPVTPTTPTQTMVQKTPPPSSAKSMLPAEYNELPSLPSLPAEPQVEDPYVEDHPLALSESDPLSQPSGDEVDEEVEEEYFITPERAESFHSSSTDSLGVPLDGRGSVQPTFARPAQGQWQFDIVSIDDLDMSDTSSEIHDPGPSAPPGLRRAPRKLPMRKDFEFVRRSEVSSLGAVSVSRDSLPSEPSSSVPSFASFTGIGRNIQAWQMNALIDSLSNDEEDGNVNDALQRLEGQINPQKQQEKRSKVDGWVRTIQERMAAGDYEDEEPRFPVDSDEEDSDEGGQDTKSVVEEDEDDRHDSVSARNVAVFNPPGLDYASFKQSQELEVEPEAGLEGVHTLLPTPVSFNLQQPPPQSATELNPTLADEAKLAVEDVVPIEILQSRLSSSLTPALPNPIPLAANVEVPAMFTSKFTQNDGLRVHRSFILNYRAVTLAEQFSMIDRELFMGVKFEELVTDEWMAIEEVNVYDWSQYLKDRARWKVENRNAEKTTALAAVRARFNLMANFVASEIALTQPSERSLLAAKFIRVAWKSYELSNFNTLTAIITALQSPWVAQAMRRSGWSRVGSFETRMFRDLKMFIAGSDDFKFIRRAVESIVDAKPLETGSHAASVTSGGAGGEAQSGKGKASAEAKPSIPTACVPFIGMYLSQLHRLKKLPDLIDPTSPNEPVGINSLTGDFNPPAHPEVFAALAPLPSTMRLEPLVNVHKQRRIAAVIKALVAGQHLASRVNYDVDKRLFQRCLRLRALDHAMLQRALAIYPD